MARVDEAFYLLNVKDNGENTTHIRKLYNLIEEDVVTAISSLKLFRDIHPHLQNEVDVIIKILTR